MLKHFQERSMKYEFIKNHESLFPIEKMCVVLGVGSSGYFKWKSKPISARLLLKEKINFTSIKNLKSGMILPEIVNNITTLESVVDLGTKEFNPSFNKRYSSKIFYKRKLRCSKQDIKPHL